ncbi:MAG: TetR/AcrR family transcriptional regulator [Acidimicrobiales bacterium]
MRTGDYAELPTADAIREAAADLFLEHGYAATTLREIADRVGLKVGSLYNHIDSKEQLLGEILRTVMTSLHGEIDAALSHVDDDAVERFHRVFEAHIRFHAEHARKVFIGNSEMRSLSDQDSRKVRRSRREYEAKIRGLIDDIASQTEAVVIDPQFQTYVILAMAPHLASWYDPAGPRSLDEIVNIYRALAVRQLGLSDDRLEPLMKPIEVNGELSE